MMTGGHFSQIVNLYHPLSFPSLPLEVGLLKSSSSDDTIAEFNIALKAEYLAISSTCSQKKKLNKQS